MSQWLRLRQLAGQVPLFFSQQQYPYTLYWRHNDHDGVLNHQPRGCLLSRLFRRRSKKTSKLRVTGFCEGDPPVTDGLPSQRASNAENVSIWWHHHGKPLPCHDNIMSQWLRLRQFVRQSGTTVFFSAAISVHETLPSCLTLLFSWMATIHVSTNICIPLNMVTVLLRLPCGALYHRLRWWLSTRLQYLHC